MKIRSAACGLAIVVVLGGCGVDTEDGFDENQNVGEVTQATDWNDNGWGDIWYWDCGNIPGNPNTKLWLTNLCRNAHNLENVGNYNLWSMRIWNGDVWKPSKNRFEWSHMHLSNSRTGGLYWNWLYQNDSTNTTACKGPLAYRSQHAVYWYLPDSCSRDGSTQYYRDNFTPAWARYRYCNWYKDNAGAVKYNNKAKNQYGTAAGWGPNCENIWSWDPDDDAAGKECTSC